MSCDGRNHPICGECWIFKCINDEVEDPTTRGLRVGYNEEGVPVVVSLPVRLKVEFAKEEICCHCGQTTKLGASVRAYELPAECPHRITT